MEYVTTFEKYAKWIPILEASRRKIDQSNVAYLNINKKCINCIKAMNKDGLDKDYYAALEGELKGLLYSLEQIERRI